MTTYLMIDASVGFRILTPTPQRKLLREQLLERTEPDTILCAPTLWLSELTSALSKSVYFGELTESEATAALELAPELSVQLFPPNLERSRSAFQWTRRLQRAAAYDSFYLALAEELECELWTMDKRLVNAVGEPWVKLAGVDAT